MKSLIAVYLVVSVSCGGASPPAAPAPVPTVDTTEPVSTLSDAECLSVLQHGFAQATAVRDAAYSPENSTSTSAGVAVPLRGAAGHAVCVATRETQWCSATESKPPCDEDLATETIYVIGVVTTATRAVTHLSTHIGDTGENESRDLLSWDVVAIGPDRDALVLHATSGSGDSDTRRDTWLTFDGAALAERLTYTTGYSAGRGGRIEPRITDRETAGHFALELDVCLGNWDYCEDEGEGGGDSPLDPAAEYERQLRGTDVCTFTPSTGRYVCDPGLALQLANHMQL